MLPIFLTGSKTRHKKQEKPSEMIRLGEKVKDTISGFEGFATARTIYFYGCIRVLVEPSGLAKDGKPHEGQWFDEARLGSASEGTGGPERPVPPAREGSTA